MKNVYTPTLHLVLEEATRLTEEATRLTEEATRRDPAKRVTWGHARR